YVNYFRKHGISFVRCQIEDIIELHRRQASNGDMLARVALMGCSRKEAMKRSTPISTPIVILLEDASSSEVKIRVNTS
uniref:Uncharacterized protein n=1 Tax=Romanomermis culicivorax TaxID=13658 RepID=A0A915HQN5_ROMCU